MGKFIIRATKTGYKFDLKASNGETIATSEVYTSEASCIKGVESVKKNGPIANLEDLTLESKAKVVNPKFEIYLDKAEEYRFRLKARNGEVIAVSEGYKEKRGCTNGIESVRKNAASAEIENQIGKSEDQSSNKSEKSASADIADKKAKIENVQSELSAGINMADKPTKDSAKPGADIDIIAKAEEIADRIKADKDFASKFKKDPSGTVESMLGKKLPDEQVDSILATINEKLKKEKGGVIAAIKRFLGIKQV